MKWSFENTIQKVEMHAEISQVYSNYYLYYIHKPFPPVQRKRQSGFMTLYTPLFCFPAWSY